MKKSIHDAAREGDIRAVRACLARGVSIDEREERSGVTPLMEACKSPDAGVDMVEFLIGAGADLTACVQSERGKRVNDLNLPVNFPKLPAGCGVDPQIFQMLEASREMIKNRPVDDPPLIVAVASRISAEKLRLLIDAGIDVNARSGCGYTAFFHAATHDRREILEMLLAAGASPDGASTYAESAIRDYSREGKFDRVRWLLELGADPAPLGWIGLHQAVVFGSMADVTGAIAAGADLEARDSWERTAFLLAVHAGDQSKAALLLEKGADPLARGRCGHTTTAYTAYRDDAPMLQWLLKWGFNPEETNDFGGTAFLNAVEHNAVECCRVLLDAGVDWQKGSHGTTPISSASQPEIVRLLLERGADLSELEPEARGAFIGLETTEDLEATPSDYLSGRSQRFGRTNPERMDIPFWKAMVGCGWSIHRALRKFKDTPGGYAGPYWTYDRFGMSLTPLQDGRFIQIGGEHEDSYDPDFCIYNDVFIHDGKGGLEILGYPEDVFPPTDFHSATLVGKWIYIIGNLGYNAASELHKGMTPVYRFHITTGVIERVKTRGDDPGWIYSHRAVLEDGQIRISGGKIYREQPGRKGRSEKHKDSYWFDPVTGIWERIAP